jgi:hypothetical protein
MRENAKMKHILVLILFVACQSNQVNDAEMIESQGTSADLYSSAVFLNDNGTYGYSILEDSIAIINQSNIPAIPGTLGFSDSLSAQKVADFVLSKVESGIFPPTLSTHEIDSLIKK